MSDPASPKQRRGRPKSPRPVAVAVEPVPVEIERQLADRIARFLFELARPDRNTQPNTPD